MDDWLSGTHLGALTPTHAGGRIIVRIIAMWDIAIAITANQCYVANHENTEYAFSPGIPARSQ